MPFTKLRRFMGFGGLGADPTQADIDTLKNQLELVNIQLAKVRSDTGDLQAKINNALAAQAGSSNISLPNPANNTVTNNAATNITPANIAPAQIFGLNWYIPVGALGLFLLLKNKQGDT